MLATYLNSWKLRQPFSFLQWLGISLFDTTLLPLLIDLLAVLAVASFQVRATPSQPLHDYLFALIILYYGWIRPLTTPLIITLQLTHQFVMILNIFTTPQPRTTHA